MTREDIIKMAREAGFPDYAMGLASEDAWQKTERFAALVTEAEREAICPIVYGLCVSDNNAQEIVNAIRARGSHKA
jgi:hypothetical protein